MLIVKLVLPEHPHQEWYIGNTVYDTDGSPCEVHLREKAKQFGTFAEACEHIIRYTKRWPCLATSIEPLTPVRP